MKNWIVLLIVVVAGVVIGNLIYSALVGKSRKERQAERLAKFAGRKRIGFKAEMEAAPASD